MKAWLWDGQAGLDHLRLAEVPNPVVGCQVKGTTSELVLP